MPPLRLMLVPGLKAVLQSGSRGGPCDEAGCVGRLTKLARPMPTVCRAFRAMLQDYKVREQALSVRAVMMRC